MIKIEGTAQELFDKAYQGLYIQNCQSLNEGGRCMYRGDYGRKCGIGHLIKDEEYKSDIENMTIFSLCQSGFVKIDTGLALLNDIQEAHDDIDADCSFRIQLNQKFEAIASKFNLKFTPASDEIFQEI